MMQDLYKQLDVARADLGDLVDVARRRLKEQPDAQPEDLFALVRSKVDIDCSGCDQQLLDTMCAAIVELANVPFMADECTEACRTALKRVDIPATVVTHVSCMSIVKNPDSTADFDRGARAKVLHAVSEELGDAAKVFDSKDAVWVRWLKPW